MRSRCASTGCPASRASWDGPVRPGWRPAGRRSCRGRTLTTGSSGAPTAACCRRCRLSPRRPSPGPASSAWTITWPPWASHRFGLAATTSDGTAITFFGFCHGVVLIRRAALAPAMPLLRRCGNGAEGILLARLAAIGAPMAPGHQPVHLPIVGRLWRQHPDQYHRAFSPADRAHGHRALGIDPQYLHGSRQASAPCATCGPPR